MRYRIERQAACARVFASVTLLLFLLALSTPVFAQGRASDYERADKLRQLTQGKVFKARVQPHWFDDGKRFWYRNDLPGGKREFILVDAETGSRGPAFDHKKLAAALGKTLEKPIAADALPVDTIEFLNAGSIKLLSKGKTFALNLASYALSEVKNGELTAPALRPGRRIRPSFRTGMETEIAFVNQTANDVALFWCDSEGKLQPYGKLAPGAKRVMHTYSGHVWVVKDDADKLLGVFEGVDNPGTANIDGKAIPEEERPPEARPLPGGSPDGKWQAFIRDDNVWLKDVASGKEEQLSKNGSKDDAYGMDFAWSPDGGKLAVIKTKPAQEHKVYLVESSPADQLQPKLRLLDYLKPGDKIAQSRPKLFDVSARKEIPVGEELIPNPWDITDVVWSRDSSRFLFTYNQRGHQVLRVVSVNAITGESTAVVDEQSKTFIDYAGKHFFQYLPATDEIVWMSERDGWNHLYLVDAKTGAVKSQITKGEWVVRGVDRVDEAKRQLWFRAGGIDPKQDPYYIHYCRVNLDGTGLVRLTEGDGTHNLDYSPDGRFVLDNYSRVDMPPVTELRRTEDGKLVCALETADASALLKTGWKTPERFVAKARDGKTDIYGVIMRPTNYRSGRKYPVIENIYAGPQDSYVPKAWSSLNGMQELAEIGFVVVQIDGMGTSNRSKAFHDVCWKNLGDAGFPDRILWMKAAAAKYPSLDVSRVGIYGGSAGGQNALGALLFHPEFYKAAVADSGCHDNRMDKIWWNELWMGWPVGPHYAAQSNVTNAAKLQGKLMLVAGEMDDNVDPSSTMQVVNALIKAGKDFDLLIIPGGGHCPGYGPYGTRRLRDFFVRNLLGVEPRM